MEAWHVAGMVSFVVIFIVGGIVRFFLVRVERLMCLPRRVTGVLMGIRFSTLICPVLGGGGLGLLFSLLYLGLLKY